jgi:hypothetical protein
MLSPAKAHTHKRIPRYARRLENVSQLIIENTNKIIEIIIKTMPQ